MFVVGSHLSRSNSTRRFFMRIHSLCFSGDSCHGGIRKLTFFLSLKVPDLEL